MEEIRIKKQPDYQPAEEAAICRRTNFKINGGQMITQHSYTIGRKEYIVNSIFDLNSNRIVADGVKRLIDNEINSAA